VLADFGMNRRYPARRLVYEEWTVNGRPKDCSANYLGLNAVLAPGIS
jgi:hypothetical protein